MIVKINSAACIGLAAYPVSAEVDVSHGLPKLAIVGLPDPSVREAFTRIRAAINNSGYHFPCDKITINLAPGSIKKEGPAYDLPMAIGILAASGAIAKEKLNDYIFLGELALDGSIRPFYGGVVIASELKNHGSFIFPYENAQEASLEKRARIYGVRHLREVVEFLCQEAELEPMTTGLPVLQLPDNTLDFSEVRGQPFARRAIEIAVAGGHNLLFIGPPGSGKTMLAQRIPSILPPLQFEEALEVTKVYSVAGLRKERSLASRRPFRAPHHTISPVALAGGGSWPRPGEVSLAHHGVLFLDEFPEFRRDVLETLRSPLEEGSIHIARSKMHASYPARVLLVAAMNPCPCGFLSDPRRPCRCTSTQIQKYQAKVSGPIFDRMDLQVEVPALPAEALKQGGEPGESSAAIRDRVLACRAVQAERYGHPYRTNASMNAHEIKRFAAPDEEGEKLIEMAMRELHLSARAYFKILKVARTIADLAGEEKLSGAHIAEAIQYRSLDRQWWL